MEQTQWWILFPAVGGVVALIGLGWWKRAWLEAFDMFDWLHLFSVVVGLAHLGFILWYYVPLMRWRGGGGYIAADGTDMGEPTDKFISDFLFSDSIYRSVMTCFVALQLAICALFVTRLNSRKEDGPFMYCVEISLFVCAWVGWTTLCAQYTNPKAGSMSKVHAAGVGVFIACSLVYVCMMSYNVYVLFETFSLLVRAEFALLAVLLITSCCLGVHFIDGALRARPDAWVTEHLAFAFFVMCHMLLFLIDSRKQRRRLDTAAVCQAGSKCPSVFDGIRITFTG